MATSPHLCLRWNNYQTNLTSVFDQLLQSETFVDVTLAADGHAIKAHRMVLSACSPYFQALFFDNPCQHPIVILKDTRWSELKAIVEYMYRGEISVAQEELTSLLRVAETLKIRGLSELNADRQGASGGDERSDSASPRAVVSATPNGILSRRLDSPAGSWPLQTQSWSRDETPTLSPRNGKRRRTSGTERSTPASPAGSVAPAPDEMSLEGPLPLVGHSHPTPASSSTSVSTPAAMSVQSSLTIHQQQQMQPSPADDLDIKPGIAELIREEERARMLEGTHPWLSTPPSVLSESLVQWRSKAPSWSKEQLQEAIQAIVTQRMRFTQASSHYGIPKGTLYDNILGKSKRMLVLDEVGLESSEEEAVLDFCCETSVMPYNRRTNKSLESIISFVEKLKHSKGHGSFKLSALIGFRWWWAFCKKHNIVSLFYAKNKTQPSTTSTKNPQRGAEDSPEDLSNNDEEASQNVATLPLYRNINNNNIHVHLSHVLLRHNSTNRSRNHSVEQDEESDVEPENLSLHKR